MLDSTTNPGRTARTFNFTSDGPGSVTAAVVATSPTDSTTICLKLDLAPSVCHSGATPEFTEQAIWAHSHWIVTLTSEGNSMPTVDVAFSWPADHPSIALSRGRFSGAPNPDSLRSITATFVTRAAGGLRLTAAWQPVRADATVTLTDISGQNDVNVDRASYAGAGEITPNYVHNVAATHTYRIALYNESTDSSTAELKATLAFP
jgi:hypothetical protein